MNYIYSHYLVCFDGHWHEVYIYSHYLVCFDGHWQKLYLFALFSVLGLAWAYPREEQRKH